MSEYCVAIVLISALAAFFELVSYSQGKEKGERLAVSVIVAYLIIAPLAPLAESAGDFDLSEITGSFGELEGGAYLEVSEEAFCLGIKRLVSEKWGVAESDSAVFALGFDFEKMKAERITITLFSKGFTADFKEIEEYIEKSGLGECEVKYAKR